MKVGAAHDYDLKISQAASPKGEAGLLIRFSRKEEKLLLFFGEPEVAELISQLRAAHLDLIQRQR